MADEFTVRTNAPEIAALVGTRSRQTRAKVRRAVEHTGLLVETRIKANASLPKSGPPGPRAITGDYRASWNTRLTLQTPDETRVTVGTDRPQARRLEQGFVGPDALGRVFNQPPYPHVQPAVEDSAEGFRDSVREALQ